MFMLVNINTVLHVEEKKEIPNIRNRELPESQNPENQQQNSSIAVKPAICHAASFAKTRGMGTFLANVWKSCFKLETSKY